MFVLHLDSFSPLLRKFLCTTLLVDDLAKAAGGCATHRPFPCGRVFESACGSKCVNQMPWERGLSCVQNSNLLAVVDAVGEGPLPHSHLGGAEEALANVPFPGSTAGLEVPMVMPMAGSYAGHPLLTILLCNKRKGKKASLSSFLSFLRFVCCYSSVY